MPGRSWPSRSSRCWWRAVRGCVGFSSVVLAANIINPPLSRSSVYNTKVHYIVETRNTFNKHLRASACAQHPGSRLSFENEYVYISVLFIRCVFFGFSEMRKRLRKREIEIWEGGRAPNWKIAYNIVIYILIYSMYNRMMERERHLLCVCICSCVIENLVDPETRTRAL